MKTGLNVELQATPIEGSFTLAGYDAGATPGVSSKSDAQRALTELREELFDLHELMMAGQERSVLLVLQGTDASGKNGTIKHVVSAVNPAGLSVSSFTEPTEEEQEHDFLWRIRKAAPAPGSLAVFDRSHYEDLLIPLAHHSADAGEIDRMAKEIMAFEEGLVESGTVIVKCLLNISYDEQRRRFLRRLRRPDKRWKFAESDIETRRMWDEFQNAYGEMVTRTNWDIAPWYVVPADNKWYRNWAIATLLVEQLRSLNLAYPQPDLDLDALREMLEPPG